MEDLELHGIADLFRWIGANVKNVIDCADAGTERKGFSRYIRNPLLWIWTLSFVLNFLIGWFL